MVSADPFYVASARSSLLDHCIDRNHHQQQQCHHGRASVQFTLDQSSSSTSPSSPSPVPPHSKAQQHNREVTSRYKSPSRYNAPMCRSPTPSSHLSPTIPRRFASPSVERSYHDATPPSKRAVSAERRRPSPSRTVLESKLATAANGNGSSALPPKRNNSSTGATRLDILWPTSKNLYSSMQAESYSSSTKSPSKSRHGSRGITSGNPSSDHTLKPSPNSVQRRKTPERKGTPLRRHSSDQLENAKPAEDAQSKAAQMLKHRWPSSLSILNLYDTALSNSVDLGNDRAKSTGRAKSVTMLHSIPTSFSSQVIPRVLPNSGPAPSVLLPAARKLSVENKSRMCGRDTPIKSRRGTQGIYDGSGLNEASSQSATSWDLGRDSADEAELASEDYITDGVKNGSSTPVSFGRTRGATSSTRSLPDVTAGRVRASSEAHRLQHSAAESDYYSITADGRQLTTRQRLTVSSETRTGHLASPPWPRSPNHLTPAYKPAQHQSLSPLRVFSGSSSLRNWQSPSGSGVLASLSPSGSIGYPRAPQFVADLRKSKKGLSQIEATYLHRILHNRLLQWRFANARADLVNMTHRQAGEKLLFSVWAKTAEIRKSVTSKRIKLQQAWQGRTINRILRVQGAKLQKWASIQHDHCNALSGAVQALEAAVLRIPVNEGIKADTHAVKEAMTSAVDVVHVMESSVRRLLPKMEKTNRLMSELAKAANQEQILLEECGDLLVVASSLEVEERSLRMQLLQFEQEKTDLLGHLMAGSD